MERTLPGRLGPEETEKVLRRAAELDRAHGGARLLPAAEEPRLDAADLHRIAAESGLSPEAVQRALSELGGGGLERIPPPRGVQRLIAGESNVAQRSFGEPADKLEARLTATLRRSGLSPIHTAPHLTRWEPAQGLHHALGRAVDWRGTGIWTGSAIESAVYPVPGERSSVELRGDAGNLMTPIAIVTGLLLSAPTGIALLVVLGLGVRWGFQGQHLLAFIGILAAWALLTAAITRGVARGRVRKLRRALEGLLGQLVQQPSASLQTMPDEPRQVH